MRIPVLLAVIGLLVASCADDAESNAPEPSVTTTPPSTAPSSSAPPTAAPSSSAPPTTVPPSTTVPSITVPSTTALPTTSAAFEPPAEFTTNEMVAARAGTHTYIGGWTITPEFDAAIEQWITGTDGAEEWFAAGGEMEIWVLDLVERTSDGIPVWTRTDLLMVDVAAGQGLAARCRIDGEPVDGLFGAVSQGSDVQWVAADAAWQVDLDALAVAAVDHGPVDCENEGFGV